MNWVDVNDSFMVNLDVLCAITKESDNETRIFTSESSSFVAPIQFETLKAIIKQRRSLETAAVESSQRSKDQLMKDLRSLAKGQRTQVP